MPHDEILVKLDLADAIALIDRQQQQIADLTAKIETYKEIEESLLSEVHRLDKIVWVEQQSEIADLTAKCESEHTAWEITNDYVKDADKQIATLTAELSHLKELSQQREEYVCGTKGGRPSWLER